MAENVDRNSPRDTSEATPPHGHDDYSPESPDLVNQLSPPEEERVTSSTDPPLVILDPSPEPIVSSSGQPQGGESLANVAGPSREGQSSSDPAPRIENPCHSDELRYPELSILLGFRPRQPVISEAMVRQAIEEVQASLEDITARAEVVGGEIEDVQANLEVAKMIKEERAQVGHSQEIAKDIKKKIEKKNSDDSNQCFYVDDTSSESQSSPENVDLGSDSSPIGSGVTEVEGSASTGNVASLSSLESNLSSKIGAAMGEEISSGSSDTVSSSSLGIGASGNVSLESDLSESQTGADIPSPGTDTTENIGSKGESSTSKTNITISVSGAETVGVKSGLSSSETISTMPGSETGTTENVALKNKLSTAKTMATIPSSGAGTLENVGIKKELSPSKTDTDSVEGSSSTSGIPQKIRDKTSPKRRSPTKFTHLSPKRSLTSADRLQTQSDSQMSKILEEQLTIEAAEGKPGSSGQELKSMETEESDENQMEETGEESTMDVPETDSQDDTAENSKMEDAE